MNFRDYITAYCDHDHTGVLSAEKRAGVELINADDHDIADLKGIEYFPALTYLSISDNKLKALDVSKNNKLKALYCSNNQLTSLDVSTCPELTELYCGNNKLTSLDVSGHTELTNLSFHGNPQISVNASGCTALTKLQGDDDKDTVKSIDVSGCTNLKEIIFYAPGILENLNVSGCTALESVLCNYNKLTRLDVSDCVNLKYLECSDNQLTGLDLTNCTALTTLWCYSNSLKRLDLTNCTALTSLWCYENQLTSLDLTKCTKLATLNCASNKLKKLDLTKCKSLEGVNCQDNLLTSLDLSACPKIVTAMKKGEITVTEDAVSVWYQTRYYYVNFDKTVTVTANGKTLYDPATASAISIKKCTVSGLDAQTYTGKALKPAPVVKYSTKKLKKGTDYTVTYADNKEIGTATVTIKGKGNYTGSVKKTFKINPQAVKLSSLTPGAKQLTVKWKKGAGGVSYELQYSLKKSFASKKTVTVAKTATVKQVIKGLTSGKTYYVRIRAFKKVGNTKYVSDWSSVLSKTVK